MDGGQERGVRGAVLFSPLLTSTLCMRGGGWQDGKGSYFLFLELHKAGETSLQAREDNFPFLVFGLGKEECSQLVHKLKEDWPGYFLGSSQLSKGQIHMSAALGGPTSDSSAQEGP